MRRIVRSRALWVLGPGLMVMLADTDAGSIVTAAQSGASRGYRLLALQLLLVPVLYLVMELTVRLGIATGKGHAELIREQFGRGWALVSVGTLVVAAVGALVTEFAGIAGVAGLLGIPAAAAVVPAACFLVWLVVAGTYRRVEIVGVALGLAELAFVIAALSTHPPLRAVAGGLSPAQPLGEPGYLALVAANIGAVVMPWMVFYQQGAVLDKGLKPRDLRAARIDTAIGAVLTQVVMASVLVASAASLHARGRGLHGIGDLERALASFAGPAAARALLVAGVLGAALVAAIVVSLALAWAVAEGLGRPRSLDDAFRGAPLFYGIYVAAVAAGAALVLTSGSLVRLAVHVEILNAILLPLVLGFLVLLAFRVLPRPYAPRLRERLALAGTVAAVAAVGLVSVGLSFGL